MTTPAPAPAPATAPAPAFESSGPAHDHEARLLSDVLRSSRLALLFGEAGSDKTAFLKNGLMPVLHRRASDRLTPPAARETGVVVPFADRRRRSPAPASKRRLEVVVYFDGWGDAPLAALQASIHQAAGRSPAAPAQVPPHLSETLAALSGQLDASFIILLDRFEEFLQSPADREDIVRFTNELVDAVTQVRLPANFLISLNEQARPRLASLRGRIPGFDDYSLKLPQPPGLRPTSSSAHVPALPETAPVAAVPTLSEAVALPIVAPTAPAETALAAAASRTAAQPKLKLPAPPRPPVTTEQVYALIEATLAHTATPVGPPRSPADPARAIPDRMRVPAEPDGLAPVAAPDHPRAAAAVPAAPLPAGVATPGRRGLTLGAAVDWLARHLRRRGAPGA